MQVNRQIRGICEVFMVLILAGTALAQTQLVVATSSDIEGFDVHGHSSVVQQAVLINVFDTMVFRDPEGAFIPSLATQWEARDDTTWYFQLRNDVVFHNGVGLTAEDIKFSFERVANDPSLLQYNYFEIIDSVEVLSDYELLIHTRTPDPVMLNRVAGTGANIVPKHYVEEVGWSAFSVNPIGTGPYRFVDWSRDDRLILEAFDDHWRGRAAYDQVTFRPIPEGSTRVSELLAGGVDIAVELAPEELSRVEASNNVEVVPWPTSRIYNIMFNVRDSVETGDIRIREAVDYAINVPALIDLATNGFGVPVRARVSPGILHVPMDLYDTHVYDPERARNLLAEAGYGPGELRLKLHARVGQFVGDSAVAETIALMLEQVGINVELELLEPSAFLNTVWRTENVEHMILAISANSFMDGWLAIRGQTCDGVDFSMTGFCNEEADELIPAIEAEMDPEVRASLVDRAFRLIFVEERAQVSLFVSESFAGRNVDVDWSARQDEYLWMFDARPNN